MIEGERMKTNTFVEYFRFKTQIESTPFIKYACEKLFPLHTWKLIGANDTDRDQQHLRVLKVFAEMTEFCGKLDTPSLKIEAILNVLYVINYKMQCNSMPCHV